MHRVTLILVLTMTVLFGCERTDFQKGRDAFQRGDYATALKEWTPIAEQGNADAQFNLGFMYLKGQGAPQNFETAIKWLTLAVEQGHAYAQGALGFMYLEGQGVPQNYVYAHMWLNLSASIGEELAKHNRDIVAKKMTPSQIEEAQKLAQEWVSKNYKGS